MSNTNTTHDSSEDLYLALLKAFRRQRASAKFRGIEFRFDFEEWLGWWCSTGCLDKRGKGRDKYVMSRFNDTGPYSPDNVFCQTFGENVHEAQYGKPKANKGN